MRHIIDLDADPFIPNGWSYEEKDQLPKRVRGEWIWNPDEFGLHVCQMQHPSKCWINGVDIKTEIIRNRIVFGVNVLDYLLDHPELIPNEWRGTFVFFWGTIYHDAERYIVVRCLCWEDGRWISNHRCLGDKWNEEHAALVRV